MSEPAAVTAVVMAKEPVPGAVKTRLCPPCTPAQAGELAASALQDTFDAVRGTRAAARRVVALQGRPGDWLPSGFEVMHQRGRGLAERIANVFASTEGPTLIVGMDTPQLTAPLLDSAAARLARTGVDAVLGPALDGGYWLLGMWQPNPAALDGVPMSDARTAVAQLERLAQMGVETKVLETLRDVDDFDDAVAVASRAQRTRFAARLRELAPDLVGAAT